jgi:hypothetical protein
VSSLASFKSQYSNPQNFSCYNSGSQLVARMTYIYRSAGLF